MSGVANLLALTSKGSDRQRLVERSNINAPPKDIPGCRNLLQKGRIPNSPMQDIAGQAVFASASGSLVHYMIDEPG